MYRAVVRRRARILVATIAVSVGLAAIPAVSASAVIAPTTGTVVLELVTLSGARLTSIDAKAHIGLTADDDSFTASSSAYRGAADYRGKISKGAYTFKGIRAGVPFATYATDAGGAYLSQSTDGHVVAAGKTLTVKLAVTKGATVSGTIKDSRGKAVSGAVAVLFTTQQSANEPNQPVGRTNSKGAFTIQAIPSGSYTLQFNTRYAGLDSATTNYNWSYWKSTTEAASPTLVLSQQTRTRAATSLTKHNGTVAPGFAIAGRITFDDGKSTTNDVLQLRSTANDRDFTYGILPASGAFSLRAVAGTYTLYVLHGGKYWYYTGATTQPSTTAAAAVTVQFGGKSNVTVAIHGTVH
jgi:hypothetical protein